RLSDLPSELAGILTGALLLVSIAAASREAAAEERRARQHARGPREPANPSRSSLLTMRNSQLAVLCAAVLGAAVIVASSNWWLVRSLERMHTGPSASPASGASAASSTRAITVAMMPKAK